MTALARVLHRPPGPATLALAVVALTALLVPFMRRGEAVDGLLALVALALPTRRALRARPVEAVAVGE